MSKRHLAVLIDLSGTLHVEDTPTPGAVEALQKLRRCPNVAFKFVTNTTKESTTVLMERLKRCGFEGLKRQQFFTSLSAARKYVDEHSLTPMLMLEPEAMEEFENIHSNGNANAVLVGLAPSRFNFNDMNAAFKLLLAENSHLVAVHKGRYYKRHDGLALGPGPFITALEFATGKIAHICGKPSPNFYNAALKSLETETGARFESVWMIGDDVRDDVVGAHSVGFNTILVKTGKFREKDLEELPTSRSHVVENFAEGVELLLKELAP